MARSLEIIEKSGVPYRLNPMGTVIEAPWDEALSVVKACLTKMAKDCNRVSAIVKIDYRKGHKGRLTSKVASVEKHLGRKLST